MARAKKKAASRQPVKRGPAPKAKVQKVAVRKPASKMAKMAKSVGGKGKGGKTSGAAKRGAAKRVVAAKPGVAKKPAHPDLVVVSASGRSYSTVTPVLIVSPCAEAMRFYEEAFGAIEHYRMAGPGGLVMHAEIQIGTSIVMLSDEQPPMAEGGPVRKAPTTAGVTTGGVMLYVDDVDAVVARAVKAGATIAMPVADMFWGDRYGQLTDPFGQVWAIGTHKRDVSHDEMAAAMRAMAQPPA